MIMYERRRAGNGRSDKGREDWLTLGKEGETGGVPKEACSVDTVVLTFCRGCSWKRRH